MKHDIVQIKDLHFFNMFVKVQSKVFYLIFYLIIHFQFIHLSLEELQYGLKIADWLVMACDKCSCQDCAVLLVCLLTVCFRFYLLQVARLYFPRVVLDMTRFRM